MQQETIYVFHKQGAKNHYVALDYLLKQNGKKLKHREFSVFSNSFKSITNFNFSLLKKQFVNFFFILNLVFTKNKKIVLGIAPFDHKLYRLLSILKNHKVFYHTSWACWDKSFHPKTKKNNLITFDNWKSFLEDKVEHIFTVTQKSKNQISNNYKIPTNKLSVVHHSLDPEFVYETNELRNRSSFIYLGRFVPQKGLKEILDYFSKNLNLSLTLIGKGKLENLVLNYAKEYSNIVHVDHTNNKKEIVKLLSQNEFLILNSKRTHKWEELFGLVIIEGMAQGVIPIATNHSGPTEIISKDFGYLFEEGQISATLDKIVETGFETNKSERAKEEAKYYLQENIALKWSAILG